MIELPKRRRGRPTKAESEARKAAEEKAAKAHKMSPDGQTEDFVDAKLAEGFTRRRTKLQPDEETLRTIFELAKLLCTQKEIAAVLGVSDRTLSTFLNIYDEARDAWEDGQSHGRISLRRKQFSLADKNAPAAIFLGKNLLGQKDVIHTNNSNVTRSANELSEDELLDILERAKTKKSAKGDQVVH